MSSEALKSSSECNIVKNKRMQFRDTGNIVNARHKTKTTTTQKTKRHYCNIHLYGITHVYKIMHKGLMFNSYTVWGINDIVLMTDPSDVTINVIGY